MDIKVGVVHVRGADDATGTGFVVHPDGLVATCSHVVLPVGRQLLGDPAPQEVGLTFLVGSQERTAEVNPDWWLPFGQGDVAILRVKGELPPGVEALPLGGSSGTTGHEFVTYGFPTVMSETGMNGSGRIGGPVGDPLGVDANARLLQLSDATNVTQGFSGGPVYDAVTRRVVGMVTTVAPPDDLDRLVGEAFITPTETLRAVCPLLVPSDDPPYRGLEPFTDDPADVELFFGRERAVDMLLARLARDRRFLAVLGASGSGKSSLVLAGLLPALERGGVPPDSSRWGVIVVRRWGKPFHELEAAGLTGARTDLDAAVRTWLKRNPSKSRLVLVLDQFEELFVASSAKERAEFIGGLARLLDGSTEITVILVMRSDFFDRLNEQSAALAERLNQSATNPWAFVLRTIERRDLLDIVRRPAILKGLNFEEGLAEEIVQDAIELAPATDGSGGGLSTTLPLLEVALTTLWKNREYGWFLRAQYYASGKVTGALRQWADAAYAALGKRQPLGRRVLCDLVQLGDERTEIPPSRRRLPRVALRRDPADRREQRAVEAVVQRLTLARLLVTDRDIESGWVTVELIHDTLIREWEQLREWLREDRRFLMWRQQLENQVHAWVATSPDPERRDTDDLIRGRELAEAEGWLLERAADLSRIERQYLEACTAQRDAVRKKEEEQIARLRDALRMSAVRQLEGDSTRQTALLREFEDPYHARGWIECAADVVRKPTWHAVVPEHSKGGFFSLVFNREGTILASQLRDGSPSLLFWQVDRKGLPIQRPVESVPGGGGTSVYNLWFGFDPVRDRFLTLSLDAVLEVLRVESVPQRRTKKLSDDLEYGSEGTITRCYQGFEVTPERSIKGLTDDFDPARDLVTAVGFSPQGRRLLTCHKNGVLRLWDLDSDTPPTPVPVTSKDAIGDGTFIANVPVSPDGRWAVLLEPKKRYGTAHLIPLGTGEDSSVRLIGTDVGAIAFRPDSASVVVASQDGSARVFSVTEDEPTLAEFRARGVPLTAVAFSPDGSRIATGAANGALRMWHVGELSPHHLRVIDADSRGITPDDPNPTFHADGMTAYRYSMPDVPIVRQAHRGEILSIRFDPGGTQMITTSSDGTAKIWRADGTGNPLELGGQENGITEAVFSPNGRWLATGTRGKTPHVWKTEWVAGPHVLLPPPWVWDGVAKVAVEASDHGDLIWTLFSDGHVRLSTADGTGHEATRKFGYHEESAMQWGGRTAPDLRWQYWQAEGLEARFFPLRGEREPFVLRGVNDKLRDVALSTDGRHILGITKPGAVFLWDADDPTVPTLWGEEAFPVTAATFSRDGKRIATGSADGAIRVWNTDGSATPKQVGRAPEQIDRVEFSADGEWLLGEDEGGYTFIGRSSREGLEIVGYPTEVRFVREGQAVLVVFSDGVVEIDRNYAWRFLRRWGKNFDLGSVGAISPDGGWVLTRSSDNDPLVWNIREDVEPTVLRGAGFDMTAVAPSPNGRRVYTGHRHGAVYAWGIDLDPRSLKDRLWQATPYCLTVDERRNLLYEDLDVAIENRKNALAKAEEYLASP